MTERDIEKESPERFARAVRADCGAGCTYPDCGHQNIPQSARRAILAWLAEPAHGEKVGKTK